MSPQIVGVPCDGRPVAGRKIWRGNIRCAGCRQTGGRCVVATSAAAAAKLLAEIEAETATRGCILANCGQAERWRGKIKRGTT